MNTVQAAALFVLETQIKKCAQKKKSKTSQHRLHTFLLFGLVFTRGGDESTKVQNNTGTETA